MTTGPPPRAGALSNLGVCRRGGAGRGMGGGGVSVDGAVVGWPARRIDPRRQQVKVDGRRVGDDTERIVLALHKPPGYVTTRVEPGGRAPGYDPLGGVGRGGFPGGPVGPPTARVGVWGQAPPPPPAP